MKLIFDLLSGGSGAVSVVYNGLDPEEAGRFLAKDRRSNQVQTLGWGPGLGPDYHRLQSFIQTVLNIQLWHIQLTLLFVCIF